LAGTWNAVFDVAGGDVAGTITIAGMPGFTQGNIVGSMRAGRIDFGVLYNNWQTAAFEGTISGRSLSGAFSTSDGAAGSWQGAFAVWYPTPVPTTSSPP
jgi:hypothetical protein